MYRAIVASMVATFVCGCGLGNWAIPWSEEECVAHLLPGDLVITEVMADPGGPEGEWFEIYNAGEETLDLAGLTIEVIRSGSDPNHETGQEGEHGGGEALAMHTVGALAIAPAAYAVLGAARPGGEAAYLDYDHGGSLGDLPSRAARLALRCDVIEVDAVELAGGFAGAAMALSAAVVPDHEANDDAASWCRAVSLYSPQNAGTPGAANDCTGSGGSSDGTSVITCTDGNRERMPVAPRPGELIITEVMANPAAVDDAVGEWFEVFIAANADVDLNGVVVGRAGDDAPGTVIDDVRCLRAAAGSYVVLGRSADSGQNGGLPGVFHEVDIGLVNTGGSLALRLPAPVAEETGQAWVVLDEVVWSRDVAGATHSLDPSVRLAAGPASNDVAESWCKGAIAYGNGDHGTPGMENPRCFVPAGMCLDGEDVRPIRMPLPGELMISELMPNPATPLSDTDAEWLEIYAAVAVDLNGLEIGSEQNTVQATLSDIACMLLPAGTYGLLARSADPQENGALPAVIAEVPVTLRQGSASAPGHIFIGWGGTVLDEVFYTESDAGLSVSRDLLAGDAWCSATPVPERMYSQENYGTPGQPNAPCALP